MAILLIVLLFVIRAAWRSASGRHWSWVTAGAIVGLSGLWIWPSMPGLLIGTFLVLLIFGELRVTSEP